MEAVPRRVRQVLRAPQAAARAPRGRGGREPRAEAGADRARAGGRRRGAGEGSWGKAIGEIKDLQARVEGDRLRAAARCRRRLQGVPRGVRLAVRQARRWRATPRPTRTAPRSTACKAEIEAVIAGGDEVVARAIAARAKARELGVLGAEIVAMVQHVIATHPDAVKGTELDPAQLRARAREADRARRGAAAQAGRTGRRRQPSTSPRSSRRRCRRTRSAISGSPAAIRSR